MEDADGSEPDIERRVFDAGLKRKHIAFVPAEGPCTASTSTAAPRGLLGERYLSITLKDCAFSTSIANSNGTSNSEESHVTQAENGLTGSPVCKICNLLVDANGGQAIAAPLHHEASLAHQVCLEHSYPPSHLDRNRQGLKYLTSYGWDPDIRLGLGASGSGIRVPVKANTKHDTVGLGLKVPEGNSKTDKKIEKLDVKGLRRREVEEKKKRDKLQKMFYGNEDVERYLGAG